MQYDISEIGTISCRWNDFDETYDVEFTDADTFHNIGYEQMSIDEIEEEFGERLASDVANECADGKEHEFEILCYQNDEIDVNNPNEVNADAVKKLRHGGYTKGCRGFILTNGVVVYTDSEHSMCTRISGVKSTFHFIELGNIRVLPSSIDIEQKPTSLQMNVLTEIFDSYYGEIFYLDLLNKELGNISIKYEQCKPEQVLNDINLYFSGRLKGRYLLRESKTIKLTKERLKKIILEAIDEI